MPYTQCGDLMKALGQNYANAKVLKVLMSPKSNELNKKILDFEHLLPMLWTAAKIKQYGLEGNYLHNNPQSQSVEEELFVGQKKDKLEAPGTSHWSYHCISPSEDNSNSLTSASLLSRHTKPGLLGLGQEVRSLTYGQLLAAMWVLGFEPGSFGRAVSALNH
ncbi:hypothetical protein STEG23_017420 [Scotinomys teguina]